MMHYALSSIQIYIGMGPSVSVSVSELGSLGSKSPRRGAEHVLGNGSWEGGREVGGGREGGKLGAISGSGHLGASSSSNDSLSLHARRRQAVYYY